MKDQEFEDEAALLLAEYGNKHGQVMAHASSRRRNGRAFLGRVLNSSTCRNSLASTMFTVHCGSMKREWVSTSGLIRQRILPCSDVTTLRWRMKPDTGGFTANYFYAVRTSIHCSLKAKNDPRTFAGRWTTYDPRDLASGSLDPLGFVRGYAPPNRLIPYTRMALSRVDGAHRRTHLDRLHRLPFPTEFSLNATSVLN